MTIEYRDRQNGRIDVVIVECPYCGDDLNGKQFAFHWRGDCEANPKHQG